MKNLIFTLIALFAPLAPAEKLCTIMPRNMTNPTEFDLAITDRSNFVEKNGEMVYADNSKVQVLRRPKPFHRDRDKKALGEALSKLGEAGVCDPGPILFIMYK